MGGSLHWRNALLPLVVAALVLSLGVWMRSPLLGYDGPPTQDAFNRYAFDRLGSYSDITSLYYRDSLADHLRPYLDYPFEYPIGTGLFVYLASLTAIGLADYFFLSSSLLVLCGVFVARLIPEFPNGNAWLWALSPVLAFYVNLNWDMLGVVFMAAALLLFVRRRDDFGAVALAAAAWIKFFPLLFLPLVLADRAKRQGWRAASGLAGVFALTSVAINAPLLLLAPEAWSHFFSFNAAREGDLNAFTLFFGLEPSSVGTMNRLSFLAVAVGLAALLALQWRSERTDTWLLACPALLAWFFLWGKVYSPQYALWIVALLAVVGASTALAVAWSATDVLYFAASFVTLGLERFGEAQGWFVGHALVPSAFLREGMLLVVVLWCAGEMWRGRRTGTYNVDRNN